MYLTTNIHREFSKKMGFVISRFPSLSIFSHKIISSKFYGTYKNPIEQFHILAHISILYVKWWVTDGLT